MPIEDTTYAIFQPGPIRNLAIGCKTGKTIIWDVKLKNIVKKFPVLSSGIKILDFNSKNTFLAAALENGETNIFSLTSNVVIGTVKVPDSKSVSSLTFHRESRAVLGIATEEGSILVKDLGINSNKMFLKTAHAAPVSQIVFSPVNCDVMGSCSLDKKVFIHDTRLTTIVTTINSNTFFTCMDWSFANLITLGTSHGEILMYDLRQYSKPVNTFKDHTLPVTRIAFQPTIDKFKKNSIMSISLKESYSPKFTSTAQTSALNKTSDSEGFLELINRTIPHSQDSTAKNVDFNDSVDSFLLHVSESTNASGVNIVENSKENIASLNNVSKSILDSSKLRSMVQLGMELNFKGSNLVDSVSTSTPVFLRNMPNEATPSPIEKYIRKESDMNGNSDGKNECSSIEKPSDSPMAPSDIDTVCNKCYNNQLNVNNEIKDFIRFSLYDISLLCRNNHCQSIFLNTKNRMFLEDQIHIMNQKMENMQSMLNTLLEENKKLMIEVQMLRLSKK